MEAEEDIRCSLETASQTPPRERGDKSLTSWEIRVSDKSHEKFLTISSPTTNSPIACYA